MTSSQMIVLYHISLEKQVIIDLMKSTGITYKYFQSFVMKFIVLCNNRQMTLLLSI